MEQRKAWGLWGIPWIISINPYVPPCLIIYLDQSKLAGDNAQLILDNIYYYYCCCSCIMWYSLSLVRRWIQTRPGFDSSLFFDNLFGDILCFTCWLEGVSAGILICSLERLLYLCSVNFSFTIANCFFSFFFLPKQSFNACLKIIVADYNFTLEVRIMASDYNFHHLKNFQNLITDYGFDNKPTY